MRENDTIEIEKLVHATTTVGFFYATNHGVDTASMRKEAANFFDLDMEDKRKIHLSNSAHFRGYSCIDEEITKGIPDHKETIDFGMEEKAEPERLEPWMAMRGPNQFPEKLPEMQKMVHDYMNQMSEVGKVIMESYAKGLKLEEDYFAKHFTRPASLLRFIKYPPTQGEKIGIGEHSDYGCLTLIDQDDVGGLQAKTLEGDWIDVTPIPGTFAVNIGDTLEGWSKSNDFKQGARLRSTPHRVINRSNNKSRLSMPFFYEPDLEMEMPEGIELKRDGMDPVQTYGEHVYRSLAGSYPKMKPSAQATLST